MKPTGGSGDSEANSLICTLAACERPHKARGYCGFHYDRWRRTADPNSVMRARRAARKTIDGVEHKQCTACQDFLPVDNFHRSGVNGRRSLCPECCRTKARESYERSRESGAAVAKARAHLLRTYGLTAEAYAVMFAAQGGRCAICQWPEGEVDARTGKPRHLAVDHCHDTGKVRGLLCGSCNRGIGMLRDDPEIVAKAHQYLLEHPTDLPCDRAAPRSRQERAMSS